MRRARPLILLAALLTYAYAAAAQPVLVGAGSNSSSEFQLLQWGVTQGGLVLVIMVVVWAYRRDFQRLFNAESIRTTELMTALQASSEALSTHAEIERESAGAAREQAKAFSDLAGTVRTCEVVREVFLAQGEKLRRRSDAPERK